jgi:leukotriene-A4 hydrolase
MARLDPHSYNDTTQPDIGNLDWKARVDFASRTLEAEATLTLTRPAAGPLDLDTRELTIASVTDDAGKPLAFELGAAEPILGARLRVSLPAGTKTLRIRYRTAATASALQWLTPAQTSGGREPYLFSQCQPTHARSIVPLQDSPRVRFTYSAEMTVPKQLRALMAAAFIERREQPDGAIERYHMPQPIPSYLFAFAVGDLASRELGPRSRVWAEPSVVEAAAWEFAGVDTMLTTAEAMFGPYEWDRFDVLTMPQSFPYGGMENPRLTFLTPTLLAGDRSMVSVLAHELAHSWTGNLVTNAWGDHFWLNEGFTVFAERRIQEALEGAEVCALHTALGRRHLDQAVERFSDHPELTKLHTNLAGVDPDDAYSEVPYEKGFLFLRTLEEAVGRDTFTKYLRRYVEAFRFKSITTEDFVAFTERELPGAFAKVDAAAWLDGAGVPGNAPAAHSSKLEQLQRLGTELPAKAVAQGWTPTEWSLYLESLPRDLAAAKCAELDERFQLTASRNYEVLVSWLALAAEAGYKPVLSRVEAVLGQVGRMKYLKPLYLGLCKRPESRAMARRTFERCKAGYHPIAAQVIEGMLKKEGAA